MESVDFFPVRKSESFQNCTGFDLTEVEDLKLKFVIDEDGTSYGLHG